MPVVGEKMSLGPLHGRQRHRPRHADFPLRFVASNATSLRAVRCAVMTRGPASDAMPPRAPRVEQRISASINRPARGESSVLGTRRRSSHRHRHADFPLRFVASNATSLRAVRCAVMARGPASDAMPPRAPRVEQRTENRHRDSHPIGTTFLAPVIATITGAKKVVPRGGVEPPTRGFSVRCSTN